MVGEEVGQQYQEGEEVVCTSQSVNDNLVLCQGHLRSWTAQGKQTTQNEMPTGSSVFPSFVFKKRFTL